VVGNFKRGTVVVESGSIIWGGEKPGEIEAFVHEGVVSLSDFKREYLKFGKTRVIALGPAVRPQVVYLAGPYRPWVDEEGVRHGIAENVRVAGRLGVQIWQRGYVALVPHTLTYLDPARQRQDGGVGGVDPQVFMDGELELVRRSDILVLMPNWHYSQGARVERTYALELGMPVYEWGEFLELGEVA
jgi:hypothetical protein